MYGDSLQYYLVSIIVIEPSTVKSWAIENGLDDSNIAALLKDERLEKAVLADMNKLAVANKFNSLEKIKQIHLT